MIVSLNISVAKYVPIFLFRMSCLINKIWSISSKMWVSSQNEQKKKKKKKKKKSNSVADLSACTSCKYMHLIFFWTRIIFRKIFTILSSGLCFFLTLSITICCINEANGNKIHEKAVL